MTKAEIIPASKAKFFLLAITLILYLPSLTASFVFDDHLLIEENPFLSSSRGILMAFTHDYYAQSNPNAQLGYYRPVSLFSHWIDWQLWKENPFGHHLTNVLLHLAAVWLLFHVLMGIFEDQNFAFLASLLFAVHPSHVNTVSFVSARVDAIATIFVLLSLYAHKKKRLLSPVFYLLGLLSKEISVTTPVLIWWEEKEKKSTRILISLIPFAVVLLGVLILRLLILHKPSAQRFTFHADFVLLLLDYIRLLILPPIRLYLEPALKNLPILLDVCCGLLYIAALLFLPDKRKSRWSAIWLITLLPVLGFVQLETLIDERFLYLPSISFCILGAAWLLRYLESRNADKGIKPKSVWMVAIVLVLIYLPINFTRQSYWNNEISLWGAAVDANPDSAKAHNNYAMALINANQLREAEEELNQSLKIQDTQVQRASAYFGLALLRHLQHRDQEVEQLYKNAIHLNPRYFIAHYNLGLFYWSQGRLEDAISELKISTALNPYSAQGHLYLAELLTRQGQKDAARIHFEAARNLGQ